MTRAAPAFLRTTTFRLTVIAAGLFAASAALLLSYVYASTARALARQTDRALEAETAVLMTAYDARGLNALNREVVQRSLGTEEFLYLLAYPSGGRMSGDLSALPPTIDVGETRAGFRYALPGPTPAADETPSEPVWRDARAYVTELRGGYRLLVAADVDENARVVGRIMSGAWSAAFLVVVLAVGAGIVISTRFARRIEGLHDVALDVMGGDLTRRAPRDSTGDEIDGLAEALNAMLDKIESLMGAMRHAGDSIAHDLRTPLTRMRNRLDAAVRDADVDPRQALEAAQADADGLLTTFNAVLRLARLEAGEQRAPLEPLALDAIASDMAEMYEPVCEDKGVRFEAEIEPDVRIMGERALVAQAVANLLDNAAKYAPEGQIVCLRVRRTSAGEAEVSVTDTGPGVPAADRERITQRFVRLDASRSEPGSGLGLALVKAVAARHGARLVLDDGPGLGPETGGVGPGLRAALVFPALRRAAARATESSPPRVSDAEGASTPSAGE